MLDQLRARVRAFLSDADRHPCPLCSRSFESESELNKHVAIDHHGDPPIVDMYGG